MDLITLSDGRPGIRAPLHCDVRSPGKDDVPGVPDQALDFVSSDETVDRYNEIISVSGWRLDTYRRNPVFQNAHQYGDIIFTLGRALATEVRTVAGRQALFQRIQFATDANPMARIAYGLYRARCLNTVSVGFIPLRWQDAPDPSSSSSSDPVAHRQVRRYLEQELLEVSAVAIPANPNAIALALKSGAIDKSDLRETIHLLRQAFATAAPQPTNSPALHLARSIRDLLKKV